MNKKYVLEIGMWTDGDEVLSETEVNDCRDEILIKATDMIGEGYLEGYPSVSIGAASVRSYWKIKDIPVEDGGPVGPIPDTTCCCPYCSSEETIVISAYGAAIKCSKCKRTFYIPYGTNSLQQNVKCSQEGSGADTPSCQCPHCSSTMIVEEPSRRRCLKCDSYLYDYDFE